MRLISVEGNIASGKSTLLDRLKEFYAPDVRVAFVPEPVDEWENIKDRRGTGMLAKYYSDQTKYAFAFQMMAYISRLSLLRRALRSGVEVVITERSVLTDRHVFARMLHRDGVLEDVEYAIYLRWFDEFLDEMPQPSIVYVRTDPDTCAHRLGVRAREGETVPLAYLRSVHEQHEAWLMTGDPANRMLTINATPDITKSPAVVGEWLSEINRFVWPLVGTAAPEPRYSWVLQFDGASRGNPGHCGAGWVLMHEGAVVAKGAHYLSPFGTNNWAEYQALIAGLSAARERGIQGIRIEGDSKLVVDQLNGDCACRSESLKALWEEAKTLLLHVGSVVLRHIPRADNRQADSLANVAIDDELRQSASGAGRGAS